MATNNKISTVVSGQLPDFVKSDHPTFVAFVKAYYEYLEQSNATLSLGKTVERAKNIPNYFDTDKINETGLNEFNDHLYDQFISSIPKETPADKSKILKNIKDFYRAKGTEKAYDFFFRLLYNEAPEIYYPKNDILIASSGKWLVERSIRLANTYINGISDESISNLKKFESTLITGNVSTATAQVERVAISYEAGIRINEFFISKKKGDFLANEDVFAVNIDGETLSANVVSGFISSVKLINGGSGYSLGTAVPIIGGGGSGASIIISGASTGNVSNVTIVSGGAGFRANDFILFTGGGGVGANARVVQVFDDGLTHPSSYNINSDIINTYNLVAIGEYSNSAGGNANTSMQNTLTFFAYANTGPARSIFLFSGGNNYTSVPAATIQGNTRIKNLGVIGKLTINNGGTGYANGARLIFTNVSGGFGFGANGNVVTNATGTIVNTNLTLLGPGHLIGGAGYDVNYLPTISVSGAGSGANIVVSALLGFGDVLVSNTGSIGVIESLTIINRGSGYVIPPTLDFSQLGDGLANANVSVVAGTFTYDGRFKDDTGLLSSSNYLEDRDYYQNFSYVIKVRKALQKYKQYVLSFIHPAGLKLFGEFLYESEPIVNNVVFIEASNTTTYIPYVTNSISFNGANSIVYRTSALENTSNSSTGTISFWFRPNNITKDQTILSIANTSNSLYPPILSVTFANTSNIAIIKIIARNAANTKLLELTTNTSTLIFKNSWNHIVATWDLSSNSNCRVYLNDLNSTKLTTINSDIISYTNGSNVSIGGEVNLTDAYDGCLSEIWFSNNYVDISNATIRKFFIGANGNLLPSNMLQSNGYMGSVSINVTPSIYLRSNVLFANVNSGVGNNFTFANNITNCSDSSSTPA